MKGIYFTALLIFVSLIDVHAQDKKVVPPGKEQIIQPAIIAGFNVTQVDGDDLTGYHKFGANVGAGAYIRLPKNLSVSFEILYSQKGSKSSSVEKDIIGGKYKLILDYIDVPLMFNYHDKEIAIFGAGISVNNLIRYKQTFTGASKPPDQEYKRIGIDGVMSVTFLIKGKIGVNMRYSYSMAKINSKAIPWSNLSYGQQRHNILGLRMMYIFK